LEGEVRLTASHSAPLLERGGSMQMRSTVKVVIRS